MTKSKNIKIYQPTILIDPEKITMTDNIIISEFCHIYGGSGIHIGNFVHISANVCVSGGGSLKIGNFVNISAGAHLITGTDSPNGDALVGAAVPKKLRKVNRSHISLEDYSWVGTGAIILPGITIGEGAVVGAGAIVTKDVAPWTIVGGNPAKKIRRRDSSKLPVLAEECIKQFELIGRTYDTIS